MLKTVGWRIWDHWIDQAGLDLNGWAGQGLCTRDGTTRCINMQYFGYIMGVNRALLDAAGVPVPTNWDEFIDAARKLTQDTDGDGITDVYGTGLHWRRAIITSTTCSISCSIPAPAGQRLKAFRRWIRLK
ncbi:extracellular solute-binding protein [Devosia sp. A8/3-2]|nr:extracellular solute-binding protein [Devosia sp. A8/3-2]